jgi:hypothetical protein
MKPSRSLLALALLLTFGLSACGSAPEEDQSQQAAEQFFAERGGGTAVAGSASDILNQPFVIGTVESVEGGTIQVKNLQGATTTVRLAADATIDQELDATLAEIQSGTTIMALGSKQDTAYQATFVQIGGDNLVMGGEIAMPKNGVPAPQGGVMVQMPLPEGGVPMQKPAGALAEPVSGVVEKADGQTIVVKQANGSTVTIAVADGARIQKQQAAKATDIQVGKTIMASGTRQGAVIEATQVRIISLVKP